jgi:hypothetical protein
MSPIHETVQNGKVTQQWRNFSVYLENMVDQSVKQVPRIL